MLRVYKTLNMKKDGLQFLCPPLSLQVILEMRFANFLWNFNKDFREGGTLYNTSFRLETQNDDVQYLKVQSTVSVIKYIYFRLNNWKRNLRVDHFSFVVANINISG